MRMHAPHNYTVTAPWLVCEVAMITGPVTLHKKINCAKECHYVHSPYNEHFSTRVTNEIALFLFFFRLLA